MIMNPVSLDVERAASRLQARYADRDIRMKEIRLVREGHIEMLFPQEFSKDWPRAITANIIDSAARDIAEAIATMPTLIVGTGRDDATARAYAAKKSKAGAAYWRESKMRKQLTTAADRYISYGFQPIVVEIDYDCNMPKLRFEDPTYAYPEFDRWGNCIRYVKVFEERRSTLANMFPEYARQFLTDRYNQPVDGNGFIRMIRYMDAIHTVLYVPSLDNGVLIDEPNPIGRCPVAVAIRPGLDDHIRGQFDEVIWVQIARNRLALLRMEAAEDSVEAPIAVPDDMQELAVGPFSVMRTRNPEGVHRVELNIPQGVFMQDEVLTDELRQGARYTGGQAAPGKAGALGPMGYDTQIQSAQVQIGEAIKEATSIAFEIDDKVFGNVERKMSGVENGSPYEISWKPSRDLKGDYSCEVTYGFYAGQSLPQAIVTLLQLRGDKDISRTTLMKNIPYDIDVEMELQNIDVEDLRETLKNTVSAVGGAIPQMVAAGGDPTAILIGMAKFIELRGKGQMPEQAILVAFPAPQQQAPDPSQPGAPPAGAPGATGPDGQPAGPMAPGQEGGMPQRPDLMQLMSSLKSDGSPSMTSTVKRFRTA